MGREMSYTFSLAATLASSFRGVMSSARNQVVGLARDVRSMEKTPVGRLGAQFEASKNKMRGLGQELKSSKAHLATLRGQMQAAGGASGTLARQIAQTERKIAGLSGKIRGSAASHKELIATINNEVGSVRRLNREYAGLSSQMEKSRAKQKALSANLAARDSNKSRRAELRGGLMDSAVMAATVAVPIKFAVGFEDAMAKVGALARADKKDLAALTAQARQLGRDTVFTANQAAEGMQFLAMAGFSTEKVMAAMPGLLDLAAAGAIDLGRASDISSNILSAFKINASDMGRVSDTLAYTFTTSNTTLETLGETMKYVGPVAAAVNMSLEDTAAAVGLLGNVGIQGTQAGTALRAALLRLSAPPKQAAEALLELTGEGVEGLDDLMAEVGGAQQALSSLGVKTKDSAGNLRPMVEILEELNLKMADMGTGEKMEKIKKIFGANASAAMVALMEQAGKTVDENGNRIVDSYGRQSTALRKYMEDINKSAGTGARIAKQMNDTTGGSLRVMRSAFEDVAIVTGNLFAPAIRSLAGAMVTGANAVSAFMEKYPGLSKAIGLAVGGTIMLSAATKGLAYGYSFVKSGLLLAQGGLLRLSGTQAAAAASTQRLGVVQRSWAMVSALTGGVLRRVAGGVQFLAAATMRATGVTRLMAGAQRAMAASTLLCGSASKIFAVGMKIMKVAMISTGIGALVVGLGLAAGYIIENWDRIGPFFSKLWDGVCGVFKTAWDFVYNKAAAVFGFLHDKFEWFRKAVAGLKKGWDFFFGGDDKVEALAGAATAAEAESPTLAANPAGAAGLDAPEFETPVSAAAGLAPAAGPASVPPELAGLLNSQDQANINMAELNDGVVGLGQDMDELNLGLKDYQALLAQGAVNQDYEPLNFDARALDGQGQAMSTETNNETNIAMEMKFDVKGLDEGEFRKKIANYRQEFEKIVRKVVAEMEHTQKRVQFAQ